MPSGQIVRTGRDAVDSILARMRAGEFVECVTYGRSQHPRAQLARAVRVIMANLDKAPVAKLRVKP